MTDIFGSIVSGPMVEAAVVDTLKYWLPTYIGEMELVTGRQRHVIPKPGSYAVTGIVDHNPGDPLPAVIVVSPGLLERPTRFGDGQMRAVWQVDIGVLAAADTPEHTHELAGTYIAAVRTLLEQKGGLRGFAESTDWLNESYDDLPADERGTLGLSVVSFAVAVASVLDRMGGPNEPSDEEDQPGSQWPVIPDRDHIHIDIVKEGLPT